MLWAMFCWETLGLDNHVDVKLTLVTYLEYMLQTRYTPSWQWYFLMSVTSFSRIMHLPQCTHCSRMV